MTSKSEKSVAKEKINVLIGRSSGILMPLTCLPSEEGIGGLGVEAHEFIDFLHESGQTWWQFLPVGHTASDGSPYNLISAFAGDPKLISLRNLLKTNLIKSSELDPLNRLPQDRVDYEKIAPAKENLLRIAFGRLKNERDFNFQKFCDRENYWLADYSLYCALKKHFQYIPWYQWPSPMRQRNPAAIKNAQSALGEEIKFWKFVQYIFHAQWTELKNYAKKRKIKLIGDLPLYMAHDSVDVWSHQNQFELDEYGHPLKVSGVPPDYFSETGQFWGHPLYRWEIMKTSGFEWWVKRLKNTLKLFDCVRLDHFIGLVRYWEIPGTAQDARSGQWMKGPGHAFFETAFEEIKNPNFIAENLGSLTEEVESLRRDWNIPGMRVLQFEIPTHENMSLDIQGIDPMSVVYTGTHDNDTLQGWLSSLAKNSQDRVLHFLSCSFSEVKSKIIRLALDTPAQLAVIPIWDFLETNAIERFNTPGTTQGNWCWRMDKSLMSKNLSQMILDLTKRSGRMEGLKLT